MIEGDEWKYYTQPVERRSRAGEQAFIDTEFCNGRMTLGEWRRRSDELSEPTKWTAEGKTQR